LTIIDNVIQILPDFLGQLDNFTGLFDVSKRFTISLAAKIGPNEAFHVNRPWVERTPPPALHDHDFFECFWIVTGSCSHFINGAVERVESGGLMFIRPSDRHAFQNTEEAPCRMVNVAFSLETAAHLLDRYAGELAGRYFWTNGRMPAAFRLNATKLRELSALEQILDRGNRSLARIESFLLALMTDLLIDAVDAAPAEAPDWMMRACDAMADPQALRSGVPALVKFSGRSHEHVSRTFRRLLGQTPSAYVNTVRMDHAARHLATSNTPISEIALDCGIDDLSHFYRLFRQIHGISPMRYRRKVHVDLVHPQDATF
jgi:AraC family cel operon transcriptional repressor